jgi:hypothetical protein
MYKPGPEIPELVFYLIFHSRWDLQVPHDDDENELNGSGSGTGRTQGPILYHGGDVLDHPKIYAIYYGCWGQLFCFSSPAVRNRSTLLLPNQDVPLCSHCTELKIHSSASASVRHLKVPRLMLRKELDYCH